MCGYCQTLTQHGSCCQCWLLSRRFVNLQPWGSVQWKRGQQHQDGLSRKPASLREGAAELLQIEGVQRENLGMLINPPLGRYLLGKCLTFICISAVKKEAFTFSPAQQSRRVGGRCDQTSRGAGGAQPAPGHLGSSVEKAVEITKVQVRLKENLEAVEKIFKPEYLLPCSLMETLQRTGWEPPLIDSFILLG